MPTYGGTGSDGRSGDDAGPLARSCRARSCTPARRGCPACVQPLARASGLREGVLCAYTRQCVRAARRSPRCCGGARHAGTACDGRVPLRLHARCPGVPMRGRDGRVEFDADPGYAGPGAAASAPGSLSWPRAAGVALALWQRRTAGASVWLRGGARDREPPRREAVADAAGVPRGVTGADGTQRTQAPPVGIRAQRAQCRLPTR